MDKPLSNFQLYVNKVIQEINQSDLAENFEKAIKFHGSKKVTIRVDQDVLDFYESLPLGYSTSMKKALRVVMEAVKARKVEL